jgi:uncharacterized protein involved in outer membrane biogenesis
MKWLKRFAIVIGVLLVILAALPFFISLDDYIPQIEKEVSARLKEPVKIGGLRAAALPLPHLVINDITVGKTGDIRVGKVTVTPDLLSLLGSVKVIRSIKIDSLVLTQKAVDKIPAWTKPESGKPPSSQLQVVVQSIRLDNALVQLGKVSFGPFDARLRLNSKGEPEDASVTTQDGKLKAYIKPGKSNYLIDVGAKSWKLPAGPAILFDELTIKGVATLNDANLNQVNARLYGGTVSGKTTVSWRKGLQLKGNFDVRQVELKPLVPLLAPGKRMSGKFSAKPVFSANAPAAGQIMNALRLQTPFDVKNGVLYGVDIEKSATSLISRDKAGSGETHFDVLSGHLAMERGTQRFTDLRIASGSLAASGHVSISPKKELSGRINAEVSAAKLASAGVPLNVSGTLDSPMLLPTGGTMGGAAVGTAILGPGFGTSVGAKVGGWAESLFGNEDEKK